MMAMTTKSSISVNPDFLGLGITVPLFGKRKRLLVLARDQREDFKPRIGKRPSIPKVPIRTAEIFAVKILRNPKMAKN
jgi:hypothetical protein